MVRIEKLKAELEDKGYAVDSRWLGTQWKCDLAVDNTVKSFFSHTELGSIECAVEQVAQWEREAADQLLRYGCEGCGE